MMVSAVNTELAGSAGRQWKSIWLSIKSLYDINVTPFKSFDILHNLVFMTSRLKVSVNQVVTSTHDVKVSAHLLPGTKCGESASCLSESSWYTCHAKLSAYLVPAKGGDVMAGVSVWYQLMLL